MNILNNFRNEYCPRYKKKTIFLPIFSIFIIFFNGYRCPNSLEASNLKVFQGFYPTIDASIRRSSP